jgi:hypothetical protein
VFIARRRATERKLNESKSNSSDADYEEDNNDNFGKVYSFHVDYLALNKQLELCIHLNSLLWKVFNRSFLIYDLTCGVHFT